MTGIETALLVGAVATSLAGGAVSTISAVGQANAQAEINKQNAERALKAGLREEARIRRRGRHKMGQLRVAQSASGVSRSGSVIDVLSESARNVEMDALEVRYRAQSQAHGYQTQAAMDKYRGKQAVVSGVINSASTLLGAAGAASQAGLFSASSAPVGTNAPIQTFGAPAGTSAGFAPGAYIGSNFAL